ncbi:DUF1499 domain-containing protein [Thaumasiovibrio subtropicus]|uniref:DUF1499 domain-containing protein n=1 Tax=Thaumasiovibrio subtropicus TaxID=1891207 RepID=UPI000B354FB7|nr:DUF1499 domain-containing protein [Thaumasiovibrio subtropicus]
MCKKLTLLTLIVALTACSKEVAVKNEQWTKKVDLPCGDKPNCVASVDNREKYAVAPIEVKAGTVLADIEAIALTLPGAKLAHKESEYLHITCTSNVFRFVDDLEIRLDGQQLVLRSESRVGYSDFGVNRKRVAKLIALLNEGNIIE